MKQKLYTTYLVALCITLSFLLLSCGKDDVYSDFFQPKATSSITAISVSPADAQITEGDSKSFTASASYSDGLTVDITSSAEWSVSENVTLGSNGLITAVSAGTATVTASYNGFSDTAEVTIEAKKDPLSITNITISPSDLEIMKGEDGVFTAIAIYSDGSTSDITSSAKWTVSGNAVMDSNGSVTAVSTGSATVTASYNDFSDSAEVTIKPQTAIFVSDTTGNDSTGTGSSKRPYQTLNHAYSESIQNSKIYVAAGDYDLTSQLIISKNIAIYGGYSASDWSRNIKTNKTQLNEASGSTSTESSPASPILITSGSPELNGLYIKGSSLTSMEYSAAVSISGGSPSIVACELDGGSGKNVYGIKIDDASATVDSCTIKGGTSGSPDIVYGLYCNTTSQYETIKFYNSVLSVLGVNRLATAIHMSANSSFINLYVYNCALIMEATSTSMTGLFLYGDIRGNTCNNTIVAHNKSEISNGCIFTLNSTSMFLFDNNIVDVLGNPNSFCITDTGTVSNVLAVSNF